MWNGDQCENCGELTAQHPNLYCDLCTDWFRVRDEWAATEKGQMDPMEDKSKPNPESIDSREAARRERARQWRRDCLQTELLDMFACSIVTGLASRDIPLDADMFTEAWSKAHLMLSTRPSRGDIFPPEDL